MLPPQQTPGLDFFGIFFQAEANRSCWQQHFSSTSLPAVQPPYTAPLSPREHSSLFSNIPATPYLSHRDFLEGRGPEPYLTNQTLTFPSTHRVLPNTLQPAFLFFHSCTLSASPSPQRGFTGADSTAGSVPGQPLQVGHPTKMGGAFSILPFHVRAFHPFFFSPYTTAEVPPHLACLPYLVTLLRIPSKASFFWINHILWVLGTHSQQNIPTQKTCKG